jgi:Na+/proline symporter
MNFDIDIAIVVIFLIINLCIGLYYGREITSIKEYSIGNQKFSTASLTATIVATWVGGNFFAFLVSKSYSDGIYYIIPIFIDYVVTFFIIGYFLAPRMKEFLGSISVAAAMGKIYGRNVQIITAISGFLAIGGLIAIQFKISASLLSDFFSISELNAMLMTSTIVIIYSAMGGIKSVTFTDVLQFFTFGTIIPLLGFLIWKDIEGIEVVLEVVENNSNYNFSGFSFSNPNFINMIQLSLIFAIPALHPSLFQRISMSNSIAQIRSSFMNSSIAAIFLVLVTCWIGILMYTVNPNIDPNTVWIHIINNYTSPGLRGIAIVGIIAMIMSTADSYINSSGILISNDIYSLFTDVSPKKKLFITRMASLIIGSLSVFLAMYSQDILDLLLIANNFYVLV